MLNYKDVDVEDSICIASAVYGGVAQSHKPQMGVFPRAGTKIRQSKKMFRKGVIIYNYQSVLNLYCSLFGSDHSVKNHLHFILHFIPF